MDQVSMEQKTQKKRSVKEITCNSNDNKSKQMMDQASIEHKITKKLVTQKEHIMDQYPDVFEGIGQFPGYHIQIDPKVPPKQTPCRMVSVHQKELFKKELDKMVDTGILKPVHDSQPWINSFVIVESKDKQGNPKLKIDLDPTNLNKAVCMNHTASKHQRI